MAPSPEDDNTPKAPDKVEKNKCEKPIASDVNNEKDKNEKTLSNLNDGELKALLDEAINYKNPKDREGKSKLFKDLLTQAEETERIARAASAGGSEVVRHYNSSAARRHRGGGGRHHHHGRHQRHRKQSSVSENGMHAGSLDNLAKEELYGGCGEATRYLVNKPKSVSARQREGGSLPCDVNSGGSSHRPYTFLEEAKKNAVMKEDKKYSVNDVESSLEAQRLLDHDSLAQTYQEQQGITIVPTFTSKATLQISATPDDPVPLDLENAETKAYDLETLQTKVLRSKYSVYIPTYRNTTTEDRKVDENGNALHQNLGTKTKKKKIQTDKNVLAFTAEKVEGHRSDIINDVDKLIQYIRGDNENSISSSSSSRTRTHHHHHVHKSKQLHKQHTSDEGSRSKKQRAHSSKGKENRPELKKSNSLGEISVAKLDEFDFASCDVSEADGEGKVVLRGKGQAGDRPKERRSWGNVEPPPFQILSSNPSTENLETADSWVVTKPKKKSKKRRNSASSSGRRQNSSFEGDDSKLSRRVPSPDHLRGKSACSAPHSEKSNDSSDADSVHSLPVEGSNAPISYADIAKNNDRSKEKKVTPEKSDKEKHLVANDVKTSSPPVSNHFKMPAEVPHARKSPAAPSCDAPKTLPPDVYDSRNFPAMPAESAVLKSPPPPNQDCKSFPVDPIEAVEDAGSFPSMPTDKSFACAPPDVGNFRSFPVISNNVRNASVGSFKSKNISPGDRNVVKCGNVDDGAKVGASESAGVVQNDIQNDLTIIHSNEKESIQFNAQMLPPNIPDVQTIEKMHFFNRPPPPTPPHRQQQQQRAPTPAHSPRTPQRDPSSSCSSSADNSIHSNSANCDNSERTVSEEGGSPPPPVVILSGMAAANKDVTDLEFGFDVNEQLLNEDACETFASRYRVPEVYDGSSHNHDKIVNFIGSSWEAVVNQSNGKVQYYKEES